LSGSVSTYTRSCNALTGESDSGWDAVHTFIRVPAGAVLATSAFADFDTLVRIAALLVGGGLALGAHGLKAATRRERHRTRGRPQVVPTSTGGVTHERRATLGARRVFASP